VVEAIGRPYVGRNIAPASAPKDAVGARSRAGRIRLCRTAVCAVPVAYPLPDIAAHVVQPQAVGLFQSNLMGATPCIPCNGIDIAAAAVFLAFATAAAGVFPLRLGRQAVVLAAALVKGGDKGLLLE